MLMAIELPRRRRFVPDIFYSLRDPDLIAVTIFSISGLLITLLLALFVPLDKAIDLLLLAD
jgi:hypothetical protein